MSLEDKIADLTKAVEKLTAAMGKVEAPAVAEPEPEPEPEEKPESKKKTKTVTKKTAPKRGGRKATEKKAGPTQADIRNALRQVSSKKGKDVAMEILAEFDVTRASDLEEEDYAEFLEMIKDELEGKNGDEDEADEDEADEDDDDI